jgi:hypothetical protein
MAKIRTLSRKFLQGHPKVGQPTYFVEKFLNCLRINYRSENYLELLKVINPDKEVETFYHSLNQNIIDTKSHTIRHGNHFKTGDLISIRCWANRPYKDKQIKLIPDIAVVKTFEFDINDNKIDLNILSYNDGLCRRDFEDWFPSQMKGQIICWDNEIQY